MLEILFSLSGFVFGVVLALIAPEELKPGKKYFKFIRNVLFVLITGFVIILIVDKFYSLFNFESSLLLLASLIFLYGLPAGTLFRLKQVERQEEKYKIKMKGNK